MTIRKRLAGSFLGMLLAVAGVAFAPAQHALALTTTADATWMVKGKVYTSVRLGNTLYIGGAFTKVESAPSGGQSYAANNLAAIDVTTGQGMSSFTPDVTWASGTPVVRSLALSQDGSTLYVGGSFDAIDGQPRSNLGAVSTSTGSVTSYAPAVTGGAPVVAALLVTSARIYLGGNFSKVSGVSRTKLAATAPGGALDAQWKPRANDRVGVMTLAADGMSIFIGGNFETITVAGTVYNRQSVARVTPDTGTVMSWQLAPDSQLTNNRAHALIATANRLYGGFGAKGPNWVAAYNMANGSLVWKFGTVGNVQTLALQGSGDGTKLFFGGHFGTGALQQTVCGSQHLHGLAAINSPGTTGGHSPDCTWIPSLEPFGANYNGAWTLGLTSTYLWVGGGFSRIGGVSHLNLGRFTL